MCVVVCFRFVTSFSLFDKFALWSSARGTAPEQREERNGPGEGKQKQREQKRASVVHNYSCLLCFCLFGCVLCVFIVIDRAVLFFELYCLRIFDKVVYMLVCYLFVLFCFVVWGLVCVLPLRCCVCCVCDVVLLLVFCLCLLAILLFVSVCGLVCFVYVL